MMLKQYIATIVTLWRCDLRKLISEFGCCGLLVAHRYVKSSLGCVKCVKKASDLVEDGFPKSFIPGFF